MLSSAESGQAQAGRRRSGDRRHCGGGPGARAHRGVRLRARRPGEHRPPTDRLREHRPRVCQGDRPVPRPNLPGAPARRPRARTGQGGDLPYAGGPGVPVRRGRAHIVAGLPTAAHRPGRLHRMASRQGNSRLPALGPHARRTPRGCPVTTEHWPRDADYHEARDFILATADQTGGPFCPLSRMIASPTSADPMKVGCDRTSPGEETRCGPMSS